MARLLPLLFWTGLAVTFLLSVSPTPPQLPASVTDKIQHFSAFAVLTALGRAAYPKLPPLLLATALAAFGALIEFAQMTPGLNRQASGLDLLADAAGIAAALMVFALWRRFRKGDSNNR